MPQNDILTLVAETIEKASTTNGGIRNKIAQYKRVEAKAEKWAAKPPKKSEVDDYYSDMTNLSVSWVNLVVDVASMHGRHIREDLKDEMSLLLWDHVDDFIPEGCE